MRDRLPAVTGDLYAAGQSNLARWLERLTFARFRLRELAPAAEATPTRPADPAAPTPPTTPEDEEDVRRVTRVEREDVPTRAAGVAAFCRALVKPGRTAEGDAPRIPLTSKTGPHWARATLFEESVPLDRSFPRIASSVHECGTRWTFALSIPAHMTTCSRCLLTHETPNIRFATDDMCNHCSTYDAHAHVLRDFERLRPLLLDRFDRVRGKFPYDALVGLSGGKDSAYVAHTLVRDHGLKLLMMTYDNGFLTEHAEKNIAHIVEKLGQDHVFCRPSREVHRAIYRSSLRLAGLPCAGCTLPGFLHAFKLAAERNIPLLIHGRTRAQMFKAMTPGSTDPFLPMLASNLAPYDSVAARRFIVNLARKLTRTLRVFAPQPSLQAELKAMFLPDIEKLRAMPEPPELLGLFLYEPYDEERIKTVLERAIDWKRAKGDNLMGHDDCAVHAAAAYVHNIDYGYPIIRPELSTMIREGDITRASALKRLEQETCAVELDENALRALCDMTGFDKGAILGYARRAHKALQVIRIYLKARHRFFPKRDLGMFGT